MIPSEIAPYVPQVWGKAFDLIRQYNLKWEPVGIENGWADMRTRTVYSPPPTTPSGFAIFTHEVGHLVMSSEETAWRHTKLCIERLSIPEKPVMQFLSSFSKYAPAIKEVFNV